VWKDPIVEEVRKERVEIERACGGTFKGISAQAKKVQEAVQEKLADRSSVRLPALSKLD
jgi:dihydroxyacetone kinase DhaKLM complex PTS-EIIA-like component DhaM